MHLRSKIMAFDYVQCLSCAVSCENLFFLHIMRNQRHRSAARLISAFVVFWGFFSIKIVQSLYFNFTSTPEDKGSQDAACIM